MPGLTWWLILNHLPGGTEPGVPGELGAGLAGGEICQPERDRERDHGGRDRERDQGTPGGRETVRWALGRETGKKEGLAEVLLCTELGLSSSKFPHGNLLRVTAPVSGGPVPSGCSCWVALGAGGVSVRHAHTERL